MGVGIFKNQPDRLAKFRDGFIQFAFRGQRFAETAMSAGLAGIEYQLLSELGRCFGGKLLQHGNLTENLTAVGGARIKLAPRKRSSNRIIKFAFQKEGVPKKKVAGRITGSDPHGFLAFVAGFLKSIVIQEERAKRGVGYVIVLGH